MFRRLDVLPLSLLSLPRRPLARREGSLLSPKACSTFLVSVDCLKVDQPADCPVDLLLGCPLARCLYFGASCSHQLVCGFPGSARPQVNGRQWPLQQVPPEQADCCLASQQPQPVNSYFSLVCQSLAV